MGHSIHGAGNRFFFQDYTQSLQLEGGGQLWKPVRDHQTQRYWWGVLGIRGRSAAHPALQKGSAAVVWVGSLVMPHSWLICGFFLKYTHRQEFLFHWASSWSGPSTKIRILVCKEIYHLTLTCFFHFEKEHWFHSSLLIEQGMHLRREASTTRVFPSYNPCKQRLRESWKRLGQENKNQTAEILARKCFNLSWKLKSSISKIKWSTSLKAKFNSCRENASLSKQAECFCFGISCVSLSCWRISADF